MYVLLESGQWLVVVDRRVMMFLTMPLDVLLGICIKTVNIGNFCIQMYNTA